LECLPLATGSREHSNFCAIGIRQYAVDLLGATGILSAHALDGQQTPLSATRMPTGKAKTCAVCHSAQTKSWSHPERIVKTNG
jgi:hypothetical protein